jgi:Zn-dependent protease/predicted transcriptional regulator
MRRWSWRIGEFAGIGVYVHATFLLLLGWLAWSHYRAGDDLAATVEGILFVLAIFACVVFHEFGHALTAKRFGVKTRDIILLPIGGVARLERIPDKPRQELLVAIAGPAVNVAVATAIFLWLRLTGGMVPTEQLDVARGPFLERLMVVNVFLVLFNLLPAFPMDGGRILRAFLAMRLPYPRATQIAASIGQGLALVFGFLGLFTNPFLLFIALFVWIGAAQEASLAQVKSALGGLPLQQLMLTDFSTLAPHEPLTRAVELTLAGSQKDFPVVSGGRVVGILTQATLLEGLQRHGDRVAVEQVMRRDFELAHPGEAAESALVRLQATGCRVLPVVREDRLVGMINLDNVTEFLQIQAALEA